MKPAQDLVKEYLKRGIQLFLEDGNLCYNAPKGAVTQEMRLELSREKLNIIDFLMSQNNSLPDLIRAMPEKKDIPLSFTQEQLWYLNRLEGIDSTYNMMSIFRLKGAINISMIYKAFAEIVKRHEILRSIYPEKEGKPVVIIRDDVCPSLEMKDFTSFNAKERVTKVQDWVNYETQIPFNLEKGPLFRLSFGVLDTDDHLLVLTVHHIISDGWSMGILFKEWEQLYNSYLAKSSASLPQLPIQYFDYAFYQRECFQNNKYQASLEFWQAKLAGAQHYLGLPTDYPRPAVQTFIGKTLRRIINKVVSEQLKSLSRQHDSTLFMVLLSLFGFLISRYSGQKDIIIGSPMACRNHAELDGLIGFLVNTLPFRFDFSAITTFNELFSIVKKEVSDAYSHQELPFGILIDQINPERNRSYSPLVQVLFVLQNTSQVQPAFTGLQVEEWRTDIRTSKMDLTLMMTETGDGLLCEWEFNTSLFKSETILQMAECFERLCVFSTENSQSLLSDFSLLGKDDFEKIIMEWNRTKTDYPRERTVHELFEEQVRNHPNATALICNDTIATYSELDEKAEAMKCKLLAIGLGKGEAVGVCIERSFNLIIALLAVLKAGGAYVPLDAEYPEKRITYMLENTKINIVLTQQRLKNLIPSGPRHVVCLDEAWNVLPSNQEINNHQVTADDIAYIIYTSGSTGEPKGIAIPHRGINRLVKNTNYVKITSNDVFFQGAPVSFDAATFEIWGALLNGAQLVLPPPYTLTLKEIGMALVKHKVTILWLTAGLFHLMVDNRLEDLSGIHQLLAGGDVLSVPHVKKVLQNVKGCVLINGYGPTENTTFSCCYPMTNEGEAGRTVSIGKPIANSQAYILDNNLQPVPVGIPGELCLGGDGLARGYVNRPDLTKERFIKNPFSLNSEERLYRTGDLARYRPDGNIEFLGRMDQQIKIRGFRIEISEIEAAIASYAEINEAVVVCIDDLPGGKGLVAYIVPKKEKLSQFSLRGLTEHVEKWIPKYMQPVKYVLFEKLPLNPNGKVDRKVLTAWETVPEEVSEPSAESSTGEKLLQISRKILGKEDLKAEDNFFEKGVNSLAIIRFISEIESVFEVSLTIGDFMELPTLHEVALKIDSLVGNPQTVSAKEAIAPSAESSTEEKLLQISRKILSKEDLKAEDNFFEKGVNSLAIIRFISEIESVFDVSLTIGDFMELPTLREVALKIESFLGRRQMTMAAKELSENEEYSALHQKVPEYFLSSAQKQLWFLEQVDGIKSTYNIPSVMRLKGFLNLKALEQSIYQLSCRHESLRTTFVVKEGIPIQRIHSPRPFRLSVIDLRKYSGEEKEDQVAKLIYNETQRRFDLEQYPLWRFFVLRLHEQENIIIFTVHHIIFDGWSMGVFFTELSELYKGNWSGRKITLQPIMLQYKDFAQRQNTYLENEAIYPHIKYWKEKLNQVPAFIHLPIDKPRPSIQTYSGKTTVFEIPDRISSGLKALNKKAESMMFMTTLAAYAVLLARWCGVDDLVMGVPVANRNKKDLEPIIGYFVNVLPIRVQTKGNPDFLLILKQVKVNILEAYEHQELPLEKLIKELKPQKDPAYSPLFQTMFHFYNRDLEILNLAGLEVENIEIENPTSKLDLLLTITETNNGLLGDWEYNTDLFEERTIHELTQYFLQLLEQVTENPDIKLLQIEFGAEFEKKVGNSNQKSVDTLRPISLLERKDSLTEVELKLIEIYEKIFHRSGLTREDDFYTLGGHSLLIVQLIAEIEKYFRIDLSVVDIMTNPTIGRLALIMDNMINGKLQEEFIS